MREASGDFDQWRRVVDRFITAIGFVRVGCCIRVLFDLGGGRLRNRCDRRVGGKGPVLATGGDCGWEDRGGEDGRRVATIESGIV
jgi:hypothetical protein